MTAPIVYITRCDALPDPLVPDTIYCVKREDDLFDVHFVNEDASLVRHLITKEEIITLISQMTVGSSVYKGLWNADTNTPTITTGVGIKGDFYRVSVPGTTLIDGISTWAINDIIIFDGLHWDKVEAGSAPVYSVAGKTGDVLLDKTDVGLSNVDNVQQLPHNQALAITGDATAPSTALNTGTIAISLATSGVSAGSYGNPFLNLIPIMTTDAKGRITLANALPLTSLPSDISVSGIKQSVQTAVTATGTTQATAASVSGDYIVVATGTDNQGIILPSMKPGQCKSIINKTSALIKVYPNLDSGGAFLSLSQTTREWRGMTTLGNDVYACVYGGDIYKQTNATGNFVALSQQSLNWSGMTTLGNDVYACVYGGDIYKQTNGVGAFVALNQSSLQWRSMCVLGTNIYACVDSGDIYKQTNASGNFVALSQTARAWTGMTTLGNDVYACVTGGTIYKQTNGTGNFISLGVTTGTWYKMTTCRNDVYVCMNGGDIYKLSVGQIIDALGVNTPYVVSGDSELNIRCVSTTQLYSSSSSGIALTVAEW